MCCQNIEIMKSQKNEKQLELLIVSSCLDRKRKVINLIEGLEWHLKIIKGYKLTKKSCNPQNILNQIKKEESELLQLKQELSRL